MPSRRSVPSTRLKEERFLTVFQNTESSMNPNNAQQKSRSELGHLLQEHFGPGPLELTPRLRELVERLDGQERTDSVVEKEGKS